MLKHLLVCALLVPGVAVAAQTPGQALSEFLAFELSGGRLNSEIPGLEALVYDLDEEETMSGDTITVAKLRCKGRALHRRGRVRAAAGVQIRRGDRAVQRYPPAHREGPLPAAQP